MPHSTMDDAPIYRLTAERPIKPTSTRCCPTWQQRNRGGKPLRKRPDPLQTNRTTSRWGEQMKSARSRVDANGCHRNRLRYATPKARVPRIVHLRYFATVSLHSACPHKARAMRSPTKAFRLMALLSGFRQCETYMAPFSPTTPEKLTLKPTEVVPPSAKVREATLNCGRIEPHRPR